MLDPRLPLLPDDWTIWAFSDSHGVVTGLLAGLREAGLVDGSGRWVASPRTALVGCGDYLDRGRDARGMLELLRRLQGEAQAAGGAAVLARGNHEQMVLLIREGRRDWLETWLRYGGMSTLRSYGCGPREASDPDAAMRALAAAAPGLFEWLEHLPQAVRWRDVLLVHGGLAPDHGPEDLGVVTDEHLWIRAAFYDAPWDGGEFDRYRHAGIERVVFGHTPQLDGPRLYHDGRSICIDTNAVGNPHLPSGSRKLLTLLRLTPEDATLRAGRLVTIPTDGSPDGAGDADPDGPSALRAP